MDTALSRIKELEKRLAQYETTASSSNKRKHAEDLDDESTQQVKKKKLSYRARVIRHLLRAAENCTTWDYAADDYNQHLDDQEEPSDDEWQFDPFDCSTDDPAQEE